MPSRESAVLAGVVLAVAWVVTVFDAAGTVRWPTGWIYISVLALGLLLHRVYVARHNPAVLERRQSIGEGTKGWDKVWLAVFWPLMLLIPLVAAVDIVRMNGRPLSYWAWPAGAILFATGMGTSACAALLDSAIAGADDAVGRSRRPVVDGVHGRRQPQLSTGSTSGLAASSATRRRSWMQACCVSWGSRPGASFFPRDPPSDAVGLGHRALVPNVAGVEGGYGLEQQHRDFRLGGGPLLDAAWDYNELPFAEFDRETSDGPPVHACRPPKSPPVVARSSAFPYGVRRYASSPANVQPLPSHDPKCRLAESHCRSRFHLFSGRIPESFLPSQPRFRARASRSAPHGRLTGAWNRRRNGSSTTSDWTRRGRPWHAPKRGQSRSNQAPTTARRTPSTPSEWPRPGRRWASTSSARVQPPSPTPLAGRRGLWLQLRRGWLPVARQTG